MLLDRETFGALPQTWQDGSADLAIAPKELVLTNSIQPVKKSSLDDGDVQRKVLQRIGAGNLIYVQGNYRRWSDQSGWSSLPEYELRRQVHETLRTLNGKLTATRVNSICQLMQDDVRRDISADYTDGPPYRIPMANGMIELDESGFRLRPYERTDPIVIPLACKFDREATAPRTERYLNEIFEGDDDKDQKRQLVLEAIGYSLLNTARLEVCLMLLGTGANGKSTLLNLLHAMLGHDNVANVPPSQFNRAFSRAELCGKRANIVSELSLNERLSDGDFKVIASGDHVQAERKHCDPFTFKPYCTMWFGTNHLPRVDDRSHAIERRIRVIEFNRRFADHERDPNLIDALRAELPGLLNLVLPAIQGALKRGSLIEPPSSALIKQRWLNERGHIARFIEERCQLGTAYRERFDALWVAYREWADAGGTAKPKSQKVFESDMDALGHCSIRGAQGRRMRSGLRLKRAAK